MLGVKYVKNERFEVLRGERKFKRISRGEVEFVGVGDEYDRVGFARILGVR